MDRRVCGPPEHRRLHGQYRGQTASQAAFAIHRPHTRAELREARRGAGNQ